MSRVRACKGTVLSCKRQVQCDTNGVSQTRITRTRASLQTTDVVFHDHVTRIVQKSSMWLFFLPKWLKPPIADASKQPQWRTKMAAHRHQQSLLLLAAEHAKGHRKREHRRKRQNQQRNEPTGPSVLRPERHLCIFLPFLLAVVLQPMRANMVAFCLFYGACTHVHVPSPRRGGNERVPGILVPRKPFNKN